MSIKKQVSRSVFWSAIERFSVQVSSFILGIIIARLLCPDDYALIAMLNIFMALAQSFIDSGFANALIQKKDRSNLDYSTVFYFNIIISVILYILLYNSAPFIAKFYNQSELIQITRIVGISLIINSFGIVQQAKLTVELDFKRQAKGSLVAVLISGIIGIIMAMKGFGVWALVVQTLMNNLIKVILYWVYAKWKPLFAFSYNSFKELFSFGSKLLLSGLMHTVYVNLYTLIIGKRFLPADLGFYNRAFSLAQFPSNNITNILIRAIYPIQCNIQDQHQLLKDSFVKYLRLSCLIVFPLMLTLCALAEPLVLLILKDKWAGVIPLLRILCISFMWDPVMRINNSILQVKKRSDYTLYAEILKKISAFVILFATLGFGVEIMCYGLIIYSLIDIIIIIAFSKKVIGLGLFDQIQIISPILFISLFSSIVMYLTTLLFVNSFIQIIVALITGFIILLICCYKFMYDDILLVKSLKG